MRIENYDQARALLFSKKKAGIAYTLDRMEELMEQLGHPERQIRAIHVAGTNGKGSTCAFLAAILQEEGYKVGAFNTPAFGPEKNQMTLNGVPLTEEEFRMACDEIVQAVHIVEDRRGEMVSEFELMVALTYHYFSTIHPVDIVLVEAGMGGRLDATNVLTSPIATIVTNVGLDHRQYLGDTVKEIAREKAGIAKKGVPMFTASSNEVLHEIQTVVQKLGAYMVEVKHLEEGLTERIRMQGEHQKKNAAIAVAVAKELDDRTIIELGQSSIVKGLEKAFLAGRWERVQQSPEIIIDTAHNVEAMQTVCEQIKGFPENMQVEVLFGAMRDKPVKEMLENLRAAGAVIHITGFGSERSMDLEDYQSQSILQESNYIKNPEQWIREWSNEGPTGKVLVVTGSHQFAGEVRELI
ncbi:bifunctional folylpolyglutamate synthase/dihydrofolate synthase [Salipaludibacillus sp. CF4.18]|uniref:bifunctional folylpolyglutamate synthase/dihydrofolate synthase n=1 Tax=Salipaludibacillus sp. CF4.18 TaxID=3373081 RepID=UPI003EE75BAD